MPPHPPTFSDGASSAFSPSFSSGPWAFVYISPPPPPHPFHAYCIRPYLRPSHWHIRIWEFTVCRITNEGHKSFSDSSLAHHPWSLAGETVLSHPWARPTYVCCLEGLQPAGAGNRGRPLWEDWGPGAWDCFPPRPILAPLSPFSISRTPSPDSQTLGFKWGWAGGLS